MQTHHAISVPIYQTSTFVQESPGQNKGFDYSRSNNPTRQTLENLLATLEGGFAGFAFASGLSAIDSVIKLLKAGDEIIAVDDIYGGAFRLLTHVYEKFGVTVKYVDTTNAQNVADAISERTKLVWLESPTNPTLKVSDIQRICEIAHARDILVCVDNTFASPVSQQPLKLGADLVVHSATKYLSGHSDVIAGAVITATEPLSQQIKFMQNSGGAVLAPFESWLVIRGIETLRLRVREHSSNAQQIAEYLQCAPGVGQVYYAGLATHFNHHIAVQQQTFFGGVVSFTLLNDSADLAREIVSNTNIFKLAESLGGVKSLICLPCEMTHKSTPRHVRYDAGVKDGLIRLSVGLEDPADLIQDLHAVLTRYCSARPAVTNSTEPSNYLSQLAPSNITAEPYLADTITVGGNHGA